MKFKEMVYSPKIFVFVFVLIFIRTWSIQHTCFFFDLMQSRGLFIPLKVKETLMTWQFFCKFMQMYLSVWVFPARMEVAVKIFSMDINVCVLTDGLAQTAKLVSSVTVNYTNIALDFSCKRTDIGLSCTVNFILQIEKLYLNRLIFYSYIIHLRNILTIHVPVYAYHSFHVWNYI